MTFSPTHSCLYEGRIRHRRFLPRAHAFAYCLYYTYIDLAELDDLAAHTHGLSLKAFRPMRFCRTDYAAPHDRPLADVVRDRVADALGRRPEGPVRVLTHLRYLGYCFNPVSFYYCFDADERLAAVAAEINNTPWNERHTYVVPMDPRHGGPRRRFAKAFHVSPFMPMQTTYDWRFTTPGTHLAVHMQNSHDGRKQFDASLSLKRRPWTAGAPARAALRYPLITARASLAIYVQALMLWCKRTPFYPHPRGDVGAPQRYP